MSGATLRKVGIGATLSFIFWIAHPGAGPRLNSSGRTSSDGSGIAGGHAKGGLYEELSHQGDSKRWHCRPRRHRKDATGVVVALHRGNDAEVGKSCGRKHDDGLGRRRNRQKYLDSNGARLRRMGHFRRASGRLRENQNQFHRSAGLLDLYHRSESFANRRGRGAHRRGRARRSAGDHGKSLGLLHGVRHSAGVRFDVDGPRTGEL